MTGNSHSNKWFVFPRPNQAAAARLFCFHYAGGSAQVFHSWTGRLPSSLEVVAIQLPGRGHRIGEPHIRPLLRLSQIMAHEMLPYIDKPFAFFGHSLGALLCFETARSLRSGNWRQPDCLFVSATEAPHRRSPDKALAGLPKNELIKKLHEFDGTPMEVLENEELLDLFLPTIRADFELNETYEYHPEPPLDCPIAIYGGVADRAVEPERLAAWKQMTTGSCETRMFTGGHFYINNPRLTFLQTLAADLLRLIPQSDQARYI